MRSNRDLEELEHAESDAPCEPPRALARQINLPARRERRVARVDLLDAYTQTLAFTGARVAATRPEQFGDPTPCSEWNVAALLGHILSVISSYSMLPTGGHAAAPVDPPADGQHPQVYASLARGAVLAWSEPGALERPCHHVMGTMPGSRALAIHTSDVLLHGWDLAVATGQDSTIDPELAKFAAATLRDVLHLDEGRGRFFAPALPPPDSDAQNILLAYAGRLVSIAPMPRHHS